MTATGLVPLRIEPMPGSTRTVTHLKPVRPEMTDTLCNTESMAIYALDTHTLACIDHQWSVRLGFERQHRVGAA